MINVFVRASVATTALITTKKSIFSGDVTFASLSTTKQYIIGNVFFICGVLPVVRPGIQLQHMVFVACEKIFFPHGSMRFYCM